VNRVVFAPRALVDYEAAARWYQRQHPEVGTRFSRAVSDCIKRLAAAPRLRPKMPDGTRRANVPRFPYFILYAEKADAVQIVAILHGRRHPDAWASGFGVRHDDRD
jgi:toxin ParE1/3/4